MNRYLRILTFVAISHRMISAYAQSPSPSPSESPSPEPSQSPSASPSPSPAVTPSNPYPVPTPTPSASGLPGFYESYLCCVRAYRWQYCQQGGLYDYDHPRQQISTPEGIPLPPQYTVTQEWNDCPEDEWHESYTKPEGTYSCDGAPQRKSIVTTFVEMGWVKDPEDCQAKAVPNTTNLHNLWNALGYTPTP